MKDGLVRRVAAIKNSTRALTILALFCGLFVGDSYGEY